MTTVCVWRERHSEQHRLSRKGIWAPLVMSVLVSVLGEVAGFTFVRLVSRIGGGRVSHTNSHKARLEDEGGSRMGGGKRRSIYSG